MYRWEKVKEKRNCLPLQRLALVPDGLGTEGGVLSAVGSVFFLAIESYCGISPKLICLFDLCCLESAQVLKPSVVS